MNFLDYIVPIFAHYAEIFLTKGTRDLVYCKNRLEEHEQRFKQKKCSQCRNFTVNSMMSIVWAQTTFLF